MFESIIGSYTVFDSSGITDSNLDLSIDQYKNWIITISATEYIITGNTETKILFNNSLLMGGTYEVDFITRSLLINYESDLDISSGRVSTELYDKKLVITKLAFTQMIKARFRNLYELFPNEEDPFSFIYNLYEIQVPFIYYMLSEIFRDLIIEDGDINCIKEQNNKSSYKTILKDAITLLAVDTNKNNDLDNSEKLNSIRKGKLLAR